MKSHDLVNGSDCKNKYQIKLVAAYRSIIGDCTPVMFSNVLECDNRNAVSIKLLFYINKIILHTFITSKYCKMNLFFGAIVQHLIM